MIFSDFRKMVKPIYLEKSCFCVENEVNRAFIEQWQWLVHWNRHPVSQVEILCVAPRSTQFFIPSEVDQMSSRIFWGFKWLKLNFSL